MDVWYNGDYGMSFYRYGNELNPLGSYIGHSWKNFRLIPTVRPFFKPPTVKENTNESKGQNGTSTDANLLLGFPLYNNREGSWTFYIDSTSSYEDPELDISYSRITDSSGEFVRAHDSILNGDRIRSVLSERESSAKSYVDYMAKIYKNLHGRHVAIVLDEDPNYFYEATIQIEEQVASNDSSLNGITLKYSAFPYKIAKSLTRVEVPLTNSGTMQYRTAFEVGEMPVVPYLRIVSSASGVHEWHYRIGFENPEINGVLQYAPAFSGDYDSGKPIYNYNLIMPDGDATIKLAASYKTSSKYSRSKMSFLCSNYYGGNLCDFWIYDTHVTAAMGDPVIQYAEILFRKGYL